MWNCFYDYRRGRYWSEGDEHRPETEILDKCFNSTEMSSVIANLLNLGLTNNQVSKELNTRNIKTDKGKLWTPIAIKNMRKGVANGA